MLSYKDFYENSHALLNVYVSFILDNMNYSTVYKT